MVRNLNDPGPAAPAKRSWWQWEQRFSRRQRAAITAGLLGVIGIAGFVAWRQWHASLSEDPFSLPPAVAGPARPNYGLPIPEGAHVVLPPDAIPAIKNPEFVSVSSVSTRPDAPMILVSLRGETHVYSIYLLDAHEIVNDVLGGEPIATTW